MRKRWCAMLVAIALLCGLSISAFAADPCAAYRDIDRSKWYHIAVDYCLEKGYMAGTSSTTFVPAGSVTRGMAITVIYAMAGKPPCGGIGISYQDLTANWYVPAVTWAADSGVAKGYSDTRFGPNEKVTREQLAVMFLAYAKWRGANVSASADLSKFKDQSQVSTWASNAMRWAVGSGLISGRSNNSLAPKGTATRAELSQIIYKFCTEIQDPEKTPDYENWAEAYHHYIIGGKVTGTEFALVYVNDDDVPEMICYPGDRPQSVGIMAYTFMNGKVKEVKWGTPGPMFNERKNIVYVLSGRQIDHYHYFYTIDDNGWKKIAEGRTLEVEPTVYTWNDKEVSEEEFYKSQEAMFDFDDDFVPAIYDMGEMLTILEDEMRKHW